MYNRSGSKTNLVMPIRKSHLESTPGHVAKAVGAVILVIRAVGADSKMVIPSLYQEV